MNSLPVKLSSLHFTTEGNILSVWYWDIDGAKTVLCSREFESKAIALAWYKHHAKSGTLEAWVLLGIPASNIRVVA